jgi:hypothetical protein
MRQRTKWFSFFFSFAFFPPLDQPANMKTYFGGHKKPVVPDGNDHPPQNPGVADKRMLIDFVA